jgi:hypothetical protein
VDVALQELLSIHTPSATATHLAALNALLNTQFEQFSTLLASASTPFLHPLMSILSEIQVRRGDAVLGLRTAEAALSSAPPMWPAGDLSAAEALLNLSHQPETLVTPSAAFKQACIALAKLALAKLASLDLQGAALLLKGDLQQEDLSTDVTQASSALPPLNSLIPSVFEPELLSSALLPASEVDLLMSWCHAEMKKNKMMSGSLLPLSQFFTSSSNFQWLSFENIMSRIQRILTDFLANTAAIGAQDQSSQIARSDQLLGSLQDIIEVRCIFSH